MIACRHDDKTTKTMKAKGFVVRLAPFGPGDDEPCRAQVIDSRGKIVFSATDWGLSVAMTGEDVNGDGLPDIVLEGFSGGAHCCWTYYIVSLGRHPGLLVKFENETGAAFKVNPSIGRIEIHTGDGAFDYFESPHANSPIPDVYLRIDGNKLVDISREHIADYDNRILKLNAGISREDLAHFLQTKSEDEEIQWQNVKSDVISIIQAYLYSGRSREARVTLKKMWPPFDQDRIWKLILETRRTGVLRYTGLPSRLNADR